MSQISLAGSGLLVVIITSVLNAFGIIPEPGTVEHVITALVLLAGWAAMIYGQIRRKDLRFGLLRR